MYLIERIRDRARCQRSVKQPIYRVDDEEDALPADLGEERLSLPRLDRPERNGEANPIQPRPRDLSQVLFRLQARTCKKKKVISIKHIIN